jgi:hypothetical protein
MADATMNESISLRDEGVAATFCDEASQPRLLASALFAG